MIERTLTFTVAASGERLDKFLVEHIPDYSRARIQKWIRDGHVLVDATEAKKTGLKLDEGDVIEVNIPATQPTTILPEAIPLDIIFENDDVLVINKPADMVVHPAAGHATGTLVNAVLAHAPELEGIGGEKRPGVVHRLDKDTSGVLIFAKNDPAHQHLQAQFQARTVKKRYVTLVDGAPPTAEGRIETPIGRDPRNRKKMAVVSPRKGRESITEYFTMEAFEHHTLLNVHLITGRTHQIRVHLAYLNCPIVGDTVYGRRKSTMRMKRQFLHAAEMEIILPGETEPRHFEAPLPSSLTHVLNLLRKER